MRKPRTALLLGLLALLALLALPASPAAAEEVITTRGAVCNQDPSIALSSSGITIGGRSFCDRNENHSVGMLLAIDGSPVWSGGGNACLYTLDCSAISTTRPRDPGTHEYCVQFDAIYNDYFHQGFEMDCITATG